MLEIALVGGGCALAGFAAGVAYTARRIPHILARTSTDRMRALASRTAQLRGRL